MESQGIPATNLILAISYGLSGALIFALSVPLYLGRVRMNHLYGVRFRQAYDSDENWYALNRYGSIWQMAYALVLAGLGALALFVQLEPPGWILWFIIGAPVAFALVLIWILHRYAVTLPKK